MTLVLVVDDVAAMAEQYAYDLKRLGGYDTIIAGSGRDALDVLSRESVDCVILDLELPGTDGFGVLQALKQSKNDVPVIVYTGTGNFDRCVQAVRLGAYNFIDKAEPMERVAREVENALERRRLVEEVAGLRRRLGPDTPLAGKSPAMRRLQETIVRVAPLPSPVLITGESGSGKELVAHELHRLGPGGAEAPFVAVNSAALPEQLIESELFGHERGAFTGAATLRKGAFEEAGKGTVFLDEIGELPLLAQAKLLRVLENREITRLGGNRTVPIAARVVAATNRDLEVETVEKRFRHDLYYRLNVHVIKVPPLRERLVDLPELVEHFLGVLAVRFGIKPKRLEDDALRVLQSYDWKKNNVRELRNVVERMLIAADGDVISLEQVPAEIRGEAHESAGEAGSLQRLKADAEREIVRAALEQNAWHITRTAKELGLADHASLIKIMKRLGISRDS
ncbi:MAG: sigma-54-dependent Fis family transcriptional regulator [Gemmatimonadetes bacterium]|nr:sigma-54-dependent Fis family transcriptional regulator [Gemmatimonadota bacterium]